MVPDAFDQAAERRRPKRLTAGSHLKHFAINMQRAAHREACT